MKKLLALVALVAMVAVSSVAYAASSATLTINATVNSSWDVTGCTANLSAMDYTTEGTATCTAHVRSNEATGYDLNYGAGAANALVSTGTPADTIDALADETTASCAVNNECWSFWLSTINDGTAQPDTDHVTASLVFSSEGHEAETTGDFASGENILDSTSTSADVDLVFTFDGNAVNTTPSHADYTVATTLSIL